MTTHSVKASEIERNWIVVDAAGQTLGRLASELAQTLSGKRKATYTPHLDVGDYVVVINADKVKVTGNKTSLKMYYRHTGYPSGLRTERYSDLMSKHPTRILEHAVRGMLPRGPLGDSMYRKLKVYAGPTHPHEGQVNATGAIKQEVGS